MINVRPQVYLIGETVPDRGQIAMYLEDCGYASATVDRWNELPHYTAADMVEFFGRLCYASFDETRNENITKIRKDQGQYLQNIIDSGHGSVLEHVTLNFAIRNVSRVTTHELVRHRVGVAISQESMRYVRLDKWDFVYPEAFLDEDIPMVTRQTLAMLSDDLNDVIQKSVNQMTDLLHLDGMSFEKKKRYTSALRRWLPNGIATQFGWSANLRTLRHVINMRSSEAAEEEIRVVAHQIAMICQDKYPLLFPDLAPTDFKYDIPVWTVKPC